MSDYNEMSHHAREIRKQIEALEILVTDAKERKQVIFAERLEQRIGKLCQDNNMERKPPEKMEKKYSGDF